jgi:hypothetical protein
MKLKKLYINQKLNAILKFFKLNLKSKNNLSIKLMDLGNIALGTLFLSQLISGQNFNLKIGSFGIFLLIFCYISAILLLK